MKYLAQGPSHTGKRSREETEGEEPAEDDPADADRDDVPPDAVAGEDTEQAHDQHLVDQTPMPQRPNGLLSPDSTAGGPHHFSACPHPLSPTIVVVFTSGALEEMRMDCCMNGRLATLILASLDRAWGWDSLWHRRQNLLVGL